MNIPFVDLKAQYRSIKEDIDKAIKNVIAETAFIGFRDNPFNKAFEEQFANFSGTNYCIGCANGTDAIELILFALGIGKGDEVLVPANTWISTSEAVTTIGARPVFVDSDPKLYTIDVTKIEEKITKNTKAIIPVHLYGLPAEMDEIISISKKHNLHIIEDCAQAHGAIYKGRKVGTMGIAAEFSFYPGKNLGAYGDAGCIVTNDEVLADKMRMIANHGRLGKHDHAIEGRNSRLDGIQAAILSAKLPYLAKWIEKRINNAKIYDKYFSGLGLQLPIIPDYSKHVFHLYEIQIPNRQEIQPKLKELGIETGIHYPIALPMLKAYEYLHYKPEDFPVASGQMTKLLSLPMYPELTEEQIKFIADSIKSFL